jgi:threonine dehydrogenase-like Zn-dependent dehydrogenase
MPIESQTCESSHADKCRAGGVRWCDVRSALMLGAGRVIAIDEVPERLEMAEAGGAETIDFSKTDVHDELMKRTNKRGPDSCIDAVGCEASGHGSTDAVLNKVKAATFPATDRVHVLRQAIMACRKAGTISIRASM